MHINHFRSLHCKKNIYIYIFKICYHNIFSFVKSTSIIYLAQITYYFKLLMIKSISFIELTHFFQFNQLKNLMQPGYLPTIFFFLQCTNNSIVENESVSVLFVFSSEK